MPEATPAASPQAQLVLEQPKEVVVATPAPKRFVIPDGAIEDVPPAASETPTPAQNKGPEASPATPEAKPEDEVVTPDVAAKREGRRYERRMKEAYRRIGEQEARAKAAEERAVQLEQQFKAKAPESEPKLEQFDYDPEKYATAKADYAKAQAKKEVAAEQREAASKAEHQKLLAAWEEKADRGADKYEDFAEKLGNLDPANPVHAAIMDADNGEDIAHHLLITPKVSQSLVGMPVWKQLKEIGKLEAKLAQKPVEPKAPSKAPAPITPLTGTAPTVTNEPSETDDVRDWIRKRNKQVHGRG